MDRNKPDVSRGIAFVEFGSKEDMEKAIEAANGKIIYGLGL